MYYSLIASLPELSLEKAPQIKADEFKDLCMAQLAPKDFAALEAVLDINAKSEHPFVKQWQARESQLRNAAARIRATKQKRDAVDYLRTHSGFDVMIESKVEEAFNQSTPLERERALDELRWNILDELAGNDPFATSVLLAYAVKLQLAERWASLDNDIGQAKIEKTIANIQETN